MPDPKQVLVVDDEPDIRLVIGLNLHLAGMEYGEARNGEEAVRRLTGEHWDACILDLAMPKGDGVAVLRELSGAGVLTRLPVIVLSARTTPAAALEALRQGAHEHLIKPFAPGAVAETVQDLMRLTPQEREERRQDLIRRVETLYERGASSI